MKSTAKKSSLKLIPHSSLIPEGMEVTADIEINEQTLILGFRFSGGDIVFPKDLGSPERKDNLWKETCFELFVLGEGGSYDEWNMSPTGDWQYYQFSSYRQATDNQLAMVDQPRLIRRSATEFQFKFNFENQVEAAQLKPTCVLKLASGEMSYWAAEHLDSEKPDFHRFAVRK